jgi:hypothetical protein
MRFPYHRVVSALGICGLIAFLPALLPGQAAAGDKQPQGTSLLEQRRRQYPDLARIVDLVEFVPPEFSADALLRVAASGRLQDAAWKTELLERAFDQSGLARQLVRRRVIRSETGFLELGLSRAEMSSRGFDQQLDRLSLQSRTVREMLRLDKDKALEMFQTIILPRFDPRTCADALVDDVSGYYETLAQVADSAFNDEKRHRLHVELLNHRVRAMSSPVEIAAIAKTLSSVNLTGQELGLLAGNFAAAFERINPDDRSFSFVLPSIDREVRQFIGRLRAKGISTEALIAAYRQYVIKNLTGKRCADSTKQADVLKAVIGSFNRNLASDTDARLAPLELDQIKPGQVEGEANLEPFFDDAELDRGFEQFMDLVLGKERAFTNKGFEPLSSAQKDTVEWRTRFDDFLHQVDELKPAVGEPEYRYFYRKAAAMTALLRTTPPGPERDKLMRQAVTFLAGSTFRQESPLEWYAQVQTTASAVKELSPGEYNKLLTEMERSGDPVLALYAISARILPSSP